MELEGLKIAFKKEYCVMFPSARSSLLSGSAVGLMTKPMNCLLLSERVPEISLHYFMLWRDQVPLYLCECKCDSSLVILILWFKRHNKNSSYRDVCAWVSKFLSVSSRCWTVICRFWDIWLYNWLPFDTVYLCHIHVGSTNISTFFIIWGYLKDINRRAIIGMSPDNTTFMLW